MSLPPQPNYPPSQYPAQPAYRPPFPPPGIAGGYPPRPAPTGPLSAARLLGAHAVLWPTALILMIVLYRPLEKWVLHALDGSGDLSARLRLSDWLTFTVPLLVGGALAAIFLRPGLLRVLIGVGFAGVTAALELGVIALLNSGHVDTRAVYNLVYAASLTAVCLGWLVLRGRTAGRVLIGLGTLPLAWLAQYLHDKVIQQHAVQRLLHVEFDLGVTVAVLLFLFSAVALAVPAWLAAIGARPAAPAPARVGIPAPWGAVPTGAPGWPPAPGSPAGWPGASAPVPGWSGGPPAPGQPVPGQPVPGQPVPGQPYPGQPYPGQPYPGQPYPGQSYPGQSYPGQPVQGQPVQGQPVQGQPVQGQPLPGQAGPGGWPAAPVWPPAGAPPAPGSPDVPEPGGWPGAPVR